MLLTPSLWAQSDLKNRLGTLVPLLGSDSPRVRDAAARAIVLLGEESAPLLENIRTEDPEIARALRALIRRTKKLKLQIVAPSGVQRIGSPLKLEVHLLNNTDEALLVGLTTNSRRGHGTKSGFMIKVKGKLAVRLRPDQVELIAPQNKHLIIEPEDVLRVGITLAGQDSPLRRPGDIELSIVFNGFLGPATVGRGNRLMALRAIGGPALATPRVTIRARGRKPAELDAALRSRDRKTFESVLAELLLREDEKVLVTLRRHMNNPFLRIRAIERIGAAAKEEDLELLRALAGSPEEQIEVRLVAIAGLGNYTHRKARSRLVSLTQNARLRNAAVRELTKYKSASTIDCFLRLLQRNYHEGRWSRDARAMFLHWTGKHVENRKSEIDAFERWWREHRSAWIKANR